MKKYSAIFAAVLAMAACTKVIEPSDTTREGVETRFVCSADTRITIGDKVGSTWNALWAAGDELTIVNATDESVLGTASLVSGEGQHSGIFSTTATITDGTSIKLVYGAASIKSAQVQAAPGAKDLSAITYAESAAFPFTGGSTMNFTLSHSPAIVHVTVSSTEFADLQLTDVSLYSATATLSDDVADRVGVSFTAPAALSGTQEAWFTAKPVASASDFYAVATMKGTYKGVPGTTVQIPVKFEGKTLSAGKVHSIELTGLNAASCDVDWYNPVCTRYIPMEGWCYGTENTILVNPASGSTVDFDIRANGDFFNVMRHAKKPAKLKCQMADVVNTGTWNTWSIDGTTSSNGGVVALASMTPSIGRSSNAIASSKTSVAGFFNLLDADDNVIWRFTFWASEPAAITLTNGDIMDRNLGGYDPATGTNAQQQGIWCQWGRPFGFGWASACQDAAYSTAVTDLAGSAAHASSLLITTASSPADYHWLQTAEQHVDLWGCTETLSTSKGGVKSVFDPCPKGWKVASPAILGEIVAGTQTYTTSPTNGFSVSVAGKTVFMPGTAQRDGSNGNVGGSSGATRKRLAYWSDTANKRRGFWLYCADATAASAAITMNSNRSSHGAGIRCMKDTANR